LGGERKMIENYTIIYASLFLVVLGISYGCLGGKKEGILATATLSSIATAIISALGFSLYLAFCDSAWTVNEYKSNTEKIDSIKVKDGVLTFYGPRKLGEKKVIKSKEKESKAVIFDKQRITKKDKFVGIDVSYDLEERSRSEIYLSESYYEIWKAFNDNRKK
jgi:hypothetical protein